MNRPDDVLDAIRSDIERIRADQKWCFFDGYQPLGANPDRVAGVEARDVIGRDELEVADENVRLDIGVGDGHSRSAYLGTAWLITFLDMGLVRATKALDPQASSLYVVVTPRSTLETRDRALSISARRLDGIAQAWEEASRGQRSESRKYLTSPRTHPLSARAAAYEAVRILSRALSRGATQGVATGEKLCKICAIRPVGERTGGRCTTCAQWRFRNRGEERPRSLDAAELAAPYAAAAQRRKRGEGFGNS